MTLKVTQGHRNSHRLIGRTSLPISDLGGWWRWALIRLVGVAPSQLVGVSASANLPLHHKVQKFSPGTGSPGWSWKKGRKMVVVVVVVICSNNISISEILPLLPCM